MRHTCILAVRTYFIRLKSKCSSLYCFLLIMRSLPYNLIKNPHNLKLLQNTETSFDNSVSPVSNFQIGRVTFYQHIESWFLLKNNKTIYIALIFCPWKQVIHNFRLPLALLHPWSGLRVPNTGSLNLHSHAQHVFPNTN